MGTDSFIECQMPHESETTELGAQRYRKARPMSWRCDDQPTLEEEANLPPGRQLLKLIAGELSVSISTPRLTVVGSAKASKTSRKPQTKEKAYDGG